MLAGKNKVAGRYLEDNEYAHMLLASNTSSNPNDNKPEVRDGNHIQHVNAMHHHIRLFLRKYCGVNTKYYRVSYRDALQSSCSVRIKMYPIGLSICHSVTLLQKENVARDLNPGILLEGVIGQTDSTDKVSSLCKIFSYRGVLLNQLFLNPLNCLIDQEAAFAHDPSTITRYTKG